MTLSFETKHNDDVLANSIRRQLGACVAPGTHMLQRKFCKSSVIYSYFSGSILQATYDYLLAQANYGTVYGCSYDGSKAFTVLVFRAVGNSNSSTTDSCCAHRSTLAISDTRESYFSEDTPQTMLLEESTNKENKTTTSRHQVYWSMSTANQI